MVGPGGAAQAREIWDAAERAGRGTHDVHVVGRNKHREEILGLQRSEGGRPGGGFVGWQDWEVVKARVVPGATHPLAGQVNRELPSDEAEGVLVTPRVLDDDAFTKGL